MEDNQNTLIQNSDITVFAKTNFRNREVPFGIKRDDRRRHMYVIGKTGMGKTTLMENMIIQDIVNGNGVAFVDPHGDSVEKILDYIPSSRINDVVYFNPADMEYPIAFNILESVDQNYKHLVASGLMGVFTKIWANLWSARMEYILNNSILALLDSPGNTLLGISRMLIDKKYRKKIVDNVKDPMVRSFWADEFANWNEKYRMEAIAPIQNKVGQFLSSGIIRNIVGQPRSTIDLRSLMDNKKILLMNLSKGRVGEDNSALLGAMIITKLQLAALSRVDIEESERNDFYLYVDEFQNFATESFATILSEARKYRLNLTIGHQYIGQLTGGNKNNTKVKDAVFGNVGTIISFRVGAEDAELLEKEFNPLFSQNDLINLPKHTIILKLMINGVASDPFTAITLPPSTYENTDNAEKVIRISRERYANPVVEVENKIIKWMDKDYHEQAAVIASNARFEGADEEELHRTEVTIETPHVEVAVENPEVPILPEAPILQPQQTEQALYQTIQEEPVKQQEPEQHKEPEQYPEPEQKPNLKQPLHNEPQRNDKNHALKNHPHPAHHNKQKNTQKKENSIWTTAAELNKQKFENHASELANNLTKNLNQDNHSSPENPIEQKRDNREHQNHQPDRTVLKPGQAHKITTDNDNDNQEKE